MWKLRSACAQEPVVLSLYLPVPRDPAGIRGLAAEAAGLMDNAGAHGARVSRADRESVLDALAAHGRDWLGHTVAFFACEELGLSEALPLPCLLPERAVLARRPHIRPLLAALQRSPDYRVAIADRERSWVLSVHGEQAETIARQVDPGPRSPGFGGWYGLQAHRVHQRIIQLSRQHYHQTAAILERDVPDGRVVVPSPGRPPRRRPGGTRPRGRTRGPPPSPGAPDRRTDR
jgi:peptide chain release factor subunit 1